MPCLTMAFDLRALDVHDEADAAGVMLELRVIEALLRGRAQSNRGHFLSPPNTNARGATSPRYGLAPITFLVFNWLHLEARPAKALRQSDIYGVRSYRPTLVGQSLRETKSRICSHPWPKTAASTMATPSEERRVELARLAQEEHRDRDGINRLQVDRELRGERGQMPQCGKRQREGNQGAKDGQHQQQCPVADDRQDEPRASRGREWRDRCHQQESRTKLEPGHRHRIVMAQETLVQRVEHRRQRRRRPRPPRSPACMPCGMPPTTSATPGNHQDAEQEIMSFEARARDRRAR